MTDQPRFVVTDPDVERAKLDRLQFNGTQPHRDVIRARLTALETRRLRPRAPADQLRHKP